MHYGGISSLTNPTAPANGPVVEAGWNVYGLITKHTQQNTSAGVTTTSGVYQINENKTHYLSAKQDISGMTAYQPVGDYYSASNPSGFISEVPDTYLQNTDLTISDGKITEISGVPLSAGDEFPQSATDAIGYVTATSGDINATIDNVSSNSGVWGGSALQISAGPGIKVDLVDNTLVFSNDETVLFDANDTAATSAHLSESITAFERAKFYMHDDGGHCWGCGELLSRDLVATSNPVDCGFTTPWNTTGMRCIVARSTDNTFQNWVTDGYQWWGTGGSAITSGYMIIEKVVGINRIAGGN